MSGGTLTVSGLAAGLVSGQKAIGPLTMTGTTPIGTVVDATLAAGDNTIAVPTGARAVVIVLPSSNAGNLKLRTNLNSGDAGTSFGPTGYLVLPIYTGVTSLIVNAAGTIAVEATFI